MANETSASEDEKSIESPTVKSESITVTDAERKRIYRKIDWHLLPYVSLLYLLAFLDRSNIGNAKLAGMATDLKLVGLKYNIAAAIFFIPYAFADVPSNIVLKLLRPSIWIPTLMVMWGIVMTLMSLVKSYHGLLAGRFFLGLTEAGVFPGVAFYLSLWYRRNQQSSRIAIFFSAATISGAFGGILAYGIERMEGIGGLHGWQWIFLLEGLVTVVVAFGSYFVMQDYPETAKFLTEEEKAFVISELRKDSRLTSRFDTKFIWQALGDYKTYLQICIYIGNLIPGTSLILFLPLIVKELGFSAANAQLLVIPPFAFGCFFTILTGYYSDKYNIRGPIVIVHALIGLVGYLVLYFKQTHAGPGYVGAILACIGVFPNTAVMTAWAGNNAGGDMKRAVTLAFVIGAGNLGGICASFIYYDAPLFHHGHGTAAGCLSLSILVSVFSMWNYRRLNREKEALCAKEGISAEKQDEYEDMGDGSPLFRYVI